MNRSSTCIFILYAILSSYVNSYAQLNFPKYPDSLFSTYYGQRKSQFELLPQKQGEIVFIGNSITDGAEWSELFQDYRIINRGISGDLTIGVLNRLKEVTNRKPDKIFLLIGINDLARNVPIDEILNNIYLIVSLIHQSTPFTRIFVQSIFPVNPTFNKFLSHVNKQNQIIYINQQLKSHSVLYDYTFVNVYDALIDKNHYLNANFTNDGLHLNGIGYLVWFHKIYPYVYDLSILPSLIPEPQFLKWNNELFPLYTCNTIIINQDSLMTLVDDLKNIFPERLRQSLTISNHDTDGALSIVLQIGEVPSPINQSEAYRLIVENNKIIIIGNTLHGIFNGIQTLRQLIRGDYTFVDGCMIVDWPAFSWRGYMIDVARNYQSISQLKEQLDEMAHYKLNRFHLHLTEDIAWRLQVSKFPQLTDEKFMLRNKGEYYTTDQIRDLIQYCKDRFITFIPEIDMPGHSEAFIRAMGFDMQSDSGLQIVKEILREIISNYDISYLHIGGDEVKIIDTNFISEIVSFVHKMGLKTIGWVPGANFDQRTIHQLWKSENIEHIHQKIKYIDSRDLYLNHMDPLSGVASIFNRRIGGCDSGTNSMLGAEICVWNDVRAKNEKDILLMNFVYPAMLAFSERCWKGGGYDGYLTDIGSVNSLRYKVFKNFESRLLDHKSVFFNNKPFPYVKQSDIQWKLFGPFDNHGDLDTKFWPEINQTSILDSNANITVNGGTIWLKHFFSPIVKGVLNNPQPNTTWYAFRRFYCSADTFGFFWISFYNPSRSIPIFTPDSGKWDNRESQLWINGSLVPPPHWTYPGRNGSLEDPFMDESYECRPPTKVYLKKGWNTILVKVPVGSFERYNSQYPVKWMFTVVQVQ